MGIPEEYYKNPTKYIKENFPKVADYILKTGNIKVFKNSQTGEMIDVRFSDYLEFGPLFYDEAFMEVV